MNVKTRWLFLSICLFALGGITNDLFAQAECNVWGGLRGIRVDGELMEFTTGIRAFIPATRMNLATLTPSDFVHFDSYLSRLNTPRFSRDGTGQVCEGAVTVGTNRPAGIGGGFSGRGPRPSLGGRITYEDTGPGVVNVEVEVTANSDATLTPAGGTYFLFHMAATQFTNASVKLIPAVALMASGNITAGLADGLVFSGAGRELQISFSTPHYAGFTYSRSDGSPGVTRDPRGAIDAYIEIQKGNLTNGQRARLSFTFKASAKVDKSPVNIIIDPSHPGSPFAGVGGNFRIQSRADPPQIQYNLQNLRVAWARVNMPLDQWQPIEDRDPLAVTNASQLNANVREAMEMARTLAQKKIPIISSLWAAPRWALAPPVPRPSGGGGGATSHLNPEKWDAICRSIGSYLEYMKQNYGAEPVLFSFNESDIGYNVLQTPEEHADAIKRLGACFASRGLNTKMLLGDTGDPTGINFIDVTMADSEAVKYLGGVSYHSWRGGTVDQYTRWGGAARKLKLPLLIAEGGMDADAYRYPALMQEAWYSLNEIGEYIDICCYSQPLSILHWQLTADYSILKGGQNGQPFEPAQRFWQLKQLDLTPTNAVALPITCDYSHVAACAFGDSAHREFAVHLVNTGPARTALIGGIPAGVKELKSYVTDAHRGMKELDRVTVSNGSASMILDSMSYLSLISAQ